MIQPASMIRVKQVPECLSVHSPCCWKVEQFHKGDVLSVLCGQPHRSELPVIRNPTGILGKGILGEQERVMDAVPMPECNAIPVVLEDALKEISMSV